MGAKGPGDTVNADRLVFPPRAARTTFTEYVFGVPSSATTTILIKVSLPGAGSGVVWVCPEVAAAPFTVILAVVSCNVGVTLTLVTLLDKVAGKLSVYPVVPALKVGDNVPGEIPKLLKLLLFDLPRLTVI